MQASRFGRLKHDSQLEVGLPQLLGTDYGDGTELLTLDLDAAPDAEP